MSEAELDRKALEALVVENKDLERLKVLLDQFNIFEAIGVVRQELRHSDFLAFLLDPRENHGLDDVFVKQLLQRVITAAGDASAPLTPIELELSSLDRMAVLREWQHIDVLLLDESNRLAVIIENEIGTGEHSDQLQRYYETVKRHYPDYKIVGLYLTPVGEEPSHETYLPVGYGLICEVLDDLTESRASVSNADLQTLVTHYTQMLRRHIVGDSEIAELCQRIYKEHRRALDLIYEHRPDPQAAVRDVLHELIKDTPELELEGRGKQYVFFFVREWHVPALRVARGYLKSDQIFAFVFHNMPARLTLFLESGPGNEETRRRLFEMAKKDESLFNDIVDPETNSHPKVFRRTFLTPEFYENATDSEREEEIRRHWAEFVEKDLPRIDAVLKEERWIWYRADGADETTS